ncbi:hypothetical protein Emag_006769 [Eimeria magna]
MSASEGSESAGPSNGPELEQLCSLQRLRREAEAEAAALREVLCQTTRGRIKLQLEAVRCRTPSAQSNEHRILDLQVHIGSSCPLGRCVEESLSQAILMRIREATKENRATAELALRKEEGDAAVEALEQRTELATYDQHAHVLEVQSLLETDAHTRRTKQLLVEADKHFQDALLAARTRIKGFQALTQQEAKETTKDVETLRKTLDQDLEVSLDLRERVAIHEVEEQKNCHINALKTFNEETLGKLQAYYEDITQDNLQLVKKLRSENEKTMANNRRLRKEIDAVSSNNEKIREPLQQQEALKYS